MAQTRGANAYFRHTIDERHILCHERGTLCTAPHRRERVQVRPHRLRVRKRAQQILERFVLLRAHGDVADGVRLGRGDAAFKFVGLDLAMCRTKIRGSEGMEAK